MSTREHRGTGSPEMSEPRNMDAPVVARRAWTPGQAVRFVALVLLMIWVGLLGAFVTGLVIGWQVL